MEFIVRILFSGLMAFVPSQDGKELTVLLLNVDHGYHVADGTAVPHHKPMLIARAGTSAGQCPTRDESVAQFLFADKSLDVALDALEDAVGPGGCVWELKDSDLFLRKGSAGDPALPPLVIQRGVSGDEIVPTTPLGREDFRWVPDLKAICPTCTLDRRYVDGIPPGTKVVARFRLRSGKAFTYSVSRLGNQVAPVKFARLDGTGAASPYTQAVANWVAADIKVSAKSIEIAEETFAGGRSRSMNLTPDASGKVEVAVLNMPPYVPPATRNMGEPEPGKHFEVYFDLAQNPPARELRLLPHSGAANGVTYPEVDWQYIHPQASLGSPLLEKLRIDLSRTIPEPTLCPGSSW